MLCHLVKFSLRVVVIIMVINPKIYIPLADWTISTSNLSIRNDKSHDSRVYSLYLLYTCIACILIHLPFMSGGLCGRLLLLIVKPFKSLIFGDSILSLCIELVAVKWLTLRCCVKCLKFCWFRGDMLPADRNATVRASKLSFVFSLWLAVLCGWCCCWCCAAAAVVNVWRIWLWLNVSSFNACCWFGTLLLFSSCENLFHSLVMKLILLRWTWIWCLP